MSRKLYRKAAACYLAAALPEDACRCSEQGADFGIAGRLHEKAGRWLPAARCFTQAQLWEQAVAAWEKAGKPLQAARARQRQGRLVEAAWLFAEGGRPAAGLQLLTQIAVQDLPWQLTRARCEVAAHQRKAAMARLHGLLPQVAECTGQWQMRAIGLCDLLQRPDLAALIFAQTATRNPSQTATAWRDWAHRTLGDASGVPLITNGQE